jgi:prepilin-type N-terminal cleavage/methylation domain-containing protein
MQTVKGKMREGFTLVEILVVVAITLALSVALFTMLNPIEYVARAKDSNIREANDNFIAANNAYYATFSSFPWNKNESCMNELTQDGSLDQMPDCINELKRSGVVADTSFSSNQELNQIKVTHCGDAAILCYDPESDSFSHDSTTKYTQDGRINSDCHKDGTDCYKCQALHDDPDCNRTLNTVVTPSPTPVISAIPVPTLYSTQCPASVMQTVSLENPTITATPGETVNNSLIIKSNDSTECASTFTISRGYPSSWTMNGVPPSISMNAGEVKSIPFTITIPQSAVGGSGVYQFWVAKQGQSTADPVNGTVIINGPTVTPMQIPTPRQSCYAEPTYSVENQTMILLPGQTGNNSLIINSNEESSCSSLYVISHSNPSSWTLSTIPPSVTIAGGETKIIPFSIGIPQSAVASSALVQFWVARGAYGLPANVSVTVDGPTLTPTPTPTPSLHCYTQPTYSLTYPNLTASKGEIVNNSIIIRNHDDVGCSVLYTINRSNPSSWSVSGVPASVRLAGGETKTIPFTTTISSSASSGTNIYQFWISFYTPTLDGYITVR